MIPIPDCRLRIADCGSRPPGRPGKGLAADCGSRHFRPRRGGFTLVELMIVVVIIVLVVSITAPAVGPALASNEMAEAVSTLEALLTKAQTDALSSGTAAGVRFERAYKTNENGWMVDAAGLTRLEAAGAFQGPVWLGYQQARLVRFAAFKYQAFRAVGGGSAVKLPKGAWVAPGYCIEAGFGSLAENDLWFTPLDPNAARLNRLETFYVVFDQSGRLVRFPRADTFYRDQAQPYEDGSDVVFPYAGHLDDSARCMLIYDREKFKALSLSDARRNFLQREARAVYVNRFTGSAVEGRSQ